MSWLFTNKYTFNEDISGWDTSKVNNMDFMFYNAAAFNQSIGEWNTSKVTTMGYMFRDATAFNQPIGEWDVGQVTNMLHVFKDATAFNQDIGDWNTGLVTSMSYMFNSNLASAFNQDLSRWCVSSIGVGSQAQAHFGNSGGINPSWGTCPCITSNLANTDCTALTNDNIADAVSAWLSDSATAIATYGHIKDW